MLCEICCKAVENEFPYSGRHHSGMASLESSAQKGCYICEIVLENAKTVSRFRSFRWEVNSFLNHRCLEIFLDEKYGHNPLRFLLIPDYEMDRYSSMPLPEEDPTRSNQSWDMVLRCFSHCIKNHTTCSSGVSRDEAWYPTRLIDLGDNREATPRLIVTNEMNSLSGGYTTLSHCWGDLDPIKLTKSSLEAFEESLPIHQFPKTFLDAMEVTRRLKIRYLWIDSLCIIQEGDEMKDWSHEASLMQQVYGKSTCNISASGATDSTKGLFLERNLVVKNSCAVRFLKPRKGLWAKLRPLTTEKGNIWVYHRNQFFEQIEDAPLYKRAWCIQERFLAPRNLHFGQKELFLECSEGVASGLFNLRLPPALYNPKHPFKTSHTAGGTYFDTIEAWNRVIQTYSQCALTKPEDKLVAISGVAKYFQPLLNDEYIAGLWRKNLACKLLWTVTRGHSKRVLPYRAPSFSWASMDAEIRLLSPYYESLPTIIEVLDVSISTLTDDVTGQVSDGFLRLRGCLKEVRSGEPLHNSFVASAHSYGEFPSFDAGDPELVLSDLNINKYYAVVLLQVPGPVTCLGLILHAVSRPGFQGCYERLGTFQIVSGSWSRKISEFFLQKQKNEAQIPCESYDENSGKHEFILV